MTKMKTHSAAKKRFSKVGTKRSGIKVKRSKAYRRHKFSNKTSKQKQQLRQTAYASSADEARLLSLLPY